MRRNLPPKPSYPLGIDDDSTLYLVYNTTESLLASDNEAWADEIEIVPVGEDDPEIWADNGFGTISGELFYYDAVEKNRVGKVYKLKRCIRNIAGEKTKYNSITGGTTLCPRNETYVRGLVVAEHHNQLLEAIYQLEKFIGYNFDTNQETLDYRIRCLKDCPLCMDDFCVTVNNFTVTLSSPEDADCLGVDLTYNIDITGTYEQFLLDFGDGSQTSTSLSGTHHYAPGAQIDPVLTVTSSTCQLIQTPTTRTQATLPNVTLESPFEIPIPECPDFPPISVISCDILPPNINLPPIVFPCISLSNLIPSVLISGILNIPSVISVTPVSIPSVITFGPSGLPTTIYFGSNPLPNTIDFGSNPLPSKINFGTNPLPSQISIVGSWPGFPSLQMDWGTIPTITVQVQCASTSTSFAAAPAMTGFVENEEFSNRDVGEIELDASQLVNGLGIPSEIQIITSDFPSEVKLKHELPETIKLVSDLNLPSTIHLVATDIPKTIELVPKSIPESIKLEVPANFPSKIFLDTSALPEFIKVTGIPETITLVHNLPSEIYIRKPEGLDVDLVYRGAPIDVNVKVDMTSITGSTDQNAPCVMLVPCPQGR